jgi:hypothetical protein
VEAPKQAYPNVNLEIHSYPAKLPPLVAALNSRDRAESKMWGSDTFAGRKIQ